LAHALETADRAEDAFEGEQSRALEGPLFKQERLTLLSQRALAFAGGASSMAMLGLFSVAVGDALAGQIQGWITIFGVPFGLLLATSRTVYGVCFPMFEVLRPIPPLAWVPAAIIFWPTQELSIGFVIFLGAIFTIMLNVIGGARSIDVRFFQAARSMGSSNWDIFRRIVLPGVLPSIVVGCEVGIGITWNVVVAAEMISGGGGAIQSSAGGGLGFFIWNSYIGFSYPHIVVGMISIGIAGYISSAIIRRLGLYVTPWLRVR
jgi:NitT/TauT family transport system permease protein